MNRVNFGQRSGVVVDRCSRHGIWLDCGEITHLMEWRKAGGQMLIAQQPVASLKVMRASDELNLESIISIIAGLFNN